MTQEEKDIIYRDACCRLSYHPYAAYTLNDGTTVQAQLTGADDGQYYGYILDTWGHIPDNDVRLYLRPMSSMTEKEKKEYASLIQNVHWTMVGLEARGILCIDLAECKDDSEGSIENIYNIIPLSPIDWLNKHHFDYQGLINKGLALKAPEEMYKI